MVLMHSVVSSVRGVADDSRRKKQIKTTLDQDIIKRLGVGTAMLLVVFFNLLSIRFLECCLIILFHKYPLGQHICSQQPGVLERCLLYKIIIF